MTKHKHGEPVHSIHTRFYCFFFFIFNRVSYNFFFYFHWTHYSLCCDKLTTIDEEWAKYWNIYIIKCGAFVINLFYSVFVYVVIAFDQSLNMFICWAATVTATELFVDRLPLDVPFVHDSICRRAIRHTSRWRFYLVIVGSTVNHHLSLTRTHALLLRTSF